MTAKVTLFINSAVQNNLPGQAGNAPTAGATTRIGGISESWYSPLSYRDQNLFNRAQEYGRKRAACLPNVCAVVALRFEQVNSPGKVYVLETTYSGTADTIGDIPQMALRVNVHSGESGAERKYVIGAVPDARVLRGNYNPSQAYQNALNELFTFIQANWLMQSVKKDGTTVAVSSVSNLGAVVLLNDLNLEVGDMMQILRADKNADRKFGGVFKIAAKVDNKHYTLDEWPNFAVTGGKARKFEYVYENVEIYSTDRTTPRATTRKFGRPFGGFRGRASAKS